MSYGFNDSLNGAAAGLDAATLADLAALNLGFLQGLREQGSDASLCDDDDTRHLRRALLALSQAQLERLAHCPHGLFNLSFDQPQCWPEPAASDWSAAQRPGPWTCFNLSALLFARQLAQSRGDVAELLLGLHPEVASVLQELPLGALNGLAARHSDPPRPRLAEHPRFWKDLLNFVSDGSHDGYLAAQAAGLAQSAGFSWPQPPRKPRR